MKYRGILILFICIGILFVVVELVRTNIKCPGERITYRYIPKTFEEEQQEAVTVTDIFRTMFSQPSPWVSGLTEYDKRRQEKVGKFFVSQV